MRAALAELARAARSDAPILLRAELGCDAAGLARWVHLHSPRRTNRFTAIACAGAVELSSGLRALAGGTIYLDEVGELPPAYQSALLQLAGELAGRARFISSTRHDLFDRVARGQFREDLLFRLNVVEIRVPPLRERREDIRPLVERFLSSLSETLGRLTPALTADAAAALSAHAWPGNERELANVLEGALLACPADRLGADAFAVLAPRGDPRRPRAGDDVTLEELERAHVLRVVERAPSLRHAAELLGIDETTLWRRRKRYQDDGAP